ncbi:unnamed protein product [Blepharisma stoltei]|uniref:Guanylate cyclase domain-containing protein n=1 Tax=Blepharisma stoltei TaxID=1481888 RepID=A0AAU9K1J9_9CILI|nr:unnamed protein product [Blepharisma stoltei]
MNKIVPDDGSYREFQQGIRKKVEDIIDGKVVTICMACVTIWVLFGDDIRTLSAENKDNDYIFFITYEICLSLFLIEIFMNSIFIPGYKFSFFFWLDVVATISLLPDIPGIRDPFLALFNYKLYDSDAHFDTSPVRNTTKLDYTSRGIQTIRYIRLVRIVKLYKYFTKSTENEEEENESQIDKMDPEYLGKNLSDVTTRRVIIGVLLMLLLLPLLQPGTVDNAPYFGLQTLFWTGRSGCNDPTGFGCGITTSNYVSNEGWYYMIDWYANASYPLLWLYIPDMLNGGVIGNVSRGLTWTEVSDCAGKKVPSACDKRDEEMELVTYTPIECYNKSVKGCEEIEAFARFDVGEHSRSQSRGNIVITVFVGIILATASVAFAYDTQKIVIKPVTRMHSVIKSLAEDPLKMAEEVTQIDIKESILEETINKIGTLLQMSFGLKGSEIMSSLFSEPEMNLIKLGSKERSVIALCTVQDFPSIIDCLQEEVLVFINKIARIVHTCTTRWSGTACNNDLGIFTITWPETKASDALVSLIKISAELHRATDIMAYKSNPKIVTKFGDNYLVDIAMAAHIGWIIQGPLGSNIKVAPGYISPSIDLCKKLIMAVEEFKVPLLLTGEFYSSLEEKGQNACRRIGNVMIQELEAFMGLYTFDLTDEVPLPDHRRVAEGQFDIDKRKPGDPIILNEIDIEDLEFTPEHLFLFDNDIVMMQRSVPTQFQGVFAKGLEAFEAGNWADAKQILDEALKIKVADGPCISMQEFMEACGMKPPEGWSGSRNL